MIVEIKKFRIDLGAGLIKHRIRASSGYCPKNSPEYKQEQSYMIQQLVNQPDMFISIGVPFDKASIEHNGNNWEIVTETLEQT